MLKTQQRLRIQKHNVFIKEINKIALWSNDNERMQSIDSIETYAYGTSKNVVFKKKEIKSSNITKQFKNIQLWLYHKGRHKKT